MPPTPAAIYMSKVKTTQRLKIKEWKIHQEDWNQNKLVVANITHKIGFNVKLLMWIKRETSNKRKNSSTRCNNHEL